jgi:hypothetical protein
MPYRFPFVSWPLPLWEGDECKFWDSMGIPKFTLHPCAVHRPLHYPVQVRIFFTAIFRMDSRIAPIGADKEDEVAVGDGVLAVQNTR